jgi:hypothetical protein
MIKKTLLFSSLILAVVFLSGCAKKGVQQNPEQKQTETAGEVKNEESGGIISSIKDAIGLGKKMQCTYTYNKTGETPFTSTAYIDGQKYKGETEIMGKKQLMVFDGDTMYTWSETDKTGTKFSKSCMEDLNKDKPQDSNAPAPTQDQIKSAEDAFKDVADTKCTPVDSIDFSIPTDVTFSDMCAEFQKIKDMKNNLPSRVNIPKGVNIPGGSNIPGAPGSPEL